jgi:signal transduction histidine kinase
MFDKKIDKLFLYLTIITVLLIFVLSFVGALIYLYQKRHIEYLNRINNIKSIYENELLKSKVSVQDQTFQNISREIHDNIGQRLSLAKLQITDAIAFNQLSDNEDFKMAVHSLTDAITDLRDLSRSLSADYIAVHGLIKAIENEVFQLNRTGHQKFKLIVTGESGFLKVENEIVAFRIIQESLSNIIKHAQAANVTISVYYTSELLEISVEDDGRGFDINKVHDSNGLTNIRKRAESINAIIHIKSIIGQGTLINLKIPYHATTQL